MPLPVLVVAGGHAYDRSAFMAMVEALPGVQACLVEQPAAQIVLASDEAARYAAVLFYDMWGIALPGLAMEGAPLDWVEPSASYRAAIERLVARGTGVVMLNHALVAWPAWPLWRALSRTPFMLRAGKLGDAEVPGSGFRGGAGEPDRNATVRVRPATPGHPVLAGIDAAGFEITDEIYLKTSAFERDVTPLLRADYDYDARNFTSPPLAPPEESARWTHPRGSNLVAWANACGASPVVAIELGDGPLAYANPAFRTLVANALQWSASEDARKWAARR
ncbi:MAG: ThuA domain-containing protein [Deltaproteobacteria bacterium]|nr:ThuA domain-containing protein [Deltaproteobacteria bacterium]